MRHGRAKAARKTLQFFERTVGIKAPYHVLVDGTFLVAMVKFKIPLRERLDRILQHAVFTLYTTKSCIEELEKIREGASGGKQATVEDTIKWARKECEVLDDIPDFDMDTKSMLNENYPELNELIGDPGFDILKLALQASCSGKEKGSKPSTRYFVACQDETVLDVLRRAGTVPCLRLARSVLLLENPSKFGQSQATNAERKKWSATGSVREEERRLVDIVMEEKRNKLRSQQPTTTQARKKRKAKEPNPLSCKKSNKAEDAKSSRKRRRKKSNQEGDN